MTIFLHIKTTAVDSGDDQPVEVAIVGDKGTPLVQSLLRPVERSDWPAAARSCRVMRSRIETAPTLEAILPAIREVVACQVLVAYDLYQMLALLGDALGGAAATYSAGEAFGAVADDFADELGDDEVDWRPAAYPPLSLATEFLLFKWPRASHRALARALACRAVWRYLIDDDERERVWALRDDRAAERAAVHELALDEKTAIYCANEFARLKGNELFEKLGLRPPNNGANFDAESQRRMLARRREEATEAFTGCPPHVWEKVAPWIGRIPVYRNRAAIPVNRVPRSKLVQQKVERWVIELLQPNAAYLSDSGAMCFFLYDPAQAVTIYNEYPMRHPYVPGRGKAVVTADQLRAAGFDPGTRWVVAEQFDRKTQQWQDLYEVSKSLVKQWGQCA